MTLRMLRQVGLRHRASFVDDALLHQLQKVFPAKVAGIAEYTGGHEPAVYIRWHWYFDEVRQDFVITAHGMSSNIVLVSDTSGYPLSKSTLYRFLMRRLRRDPKWKPDLSRHKARAMHQVAPAPILASTEQAPIALRPAHQDGTAAWAERAVSDLAKLDEEQQFGRLARIMREKFGFAQTLAVTRTDAGDVLREDNHVPTWGELYEREDFVSSDPRLHEHDGPTRWSAGQRSDGAEMFWDAAAQHGAMAGWLMPSSDGLSSFVASRAGAPIDDDELRMIEPNLVVLAAFAHDLLKRRLTSQAAKHLFDDKHMIVLAGWRDGKDRQQLADMTSKSMASVDRYVRNIKRQLGVRSPSEAVAKAIEIGLISKH